VRWIAHSISSVPVPVVSCRGRWIGCSVLCTPLFRLFFCRLMAYVCFVCETHFNLRRDLTRHFDKQHSSYKVCQHCRLTFNADQVAAHEENCRVDVKARQDATMLGTPIPPLTVTYTTARSRPITRPVLWKYEMLCAPLCSGADSTADLAPGTSKRLLGAPQPATADHVHYGITGWSMLCNIL
jgi:hypothetical protein